MTWAGATSAAETIWPEESITAPFRDSKVAIHRICNTHPARRSCVEALGHSVAAFQPAKSPASGRITILRDANDAVQWVRSEMFGCITPEEQRDVGEGDAVPPGDIYRCSRGG